MLASLVKGKHLSEVTFLTYLMKEMLELKSEFNVLYSSKKRTYFKFLIDTDLGRYSVAASNIPNLLLTALYCQFWLGISGLIDEAYEAFLSWVKQLKHQ